MGARAQLLFNEFQNHITFDEK